MAQKTMHTHGSQGLDAIPNPAKADRPVAQAGKALIMGEDKGQA